MQVSGKSSAEVERQTDHILTLMTDAILELKAMQVRRITENGHRISHLAFIFLGKSINTTNATQLNAKLKPKSIIIATFQSSDLRPPQASRERLEEPWRTR